MNDINRKASMMAIAGGAAFWAANFAVSLTPLAAEYRAALSISYFPMIAESLIGGLIIGALVTFSLLRYYDRIPSRGPVLKSVVLSLVALLLIEALSTLSDLGNVSAYILTGSALNVPRFLALGVVIGYLYGKFMRNRVSLTSSGGV